MALGLPLFADLRECPTMTREVTSIRQSLLAGAVAAALACRQGDYVPADTRSGTVRPPPNVGVQATCGVAPSTALTGDGLGDLRVGARAEDVSRGCRVVRDTTVRSTEGQVEREILVDVGRDTVRAVVADGRIWRIHVQSPAFRTADSIGVGTPVSALRRPGARVLVGEGALFAALPTHCGLSFRLRGAPFGRVSSMSQIPDSARVGEVLAIGCRR